MIAIASKNVDGDVRWHLTEGNSIPLPDSSVDAAFSCEVFQHLTSVEFGFNYFCENARVLKPGGSMMVHSPLYSLPEDGSQKFAGLLSLLFERVGVPLQNAKSALKRFLVRFGGTPPMNGLDYEMKNLLSALSEMGFGQIEFISFR